MIAVKEQVLTESGRRRGTSKEMYDPGRWCRGAAHLQFSACFAQRTSQVYSQVVVSATSAQETDRPVARTKLGSR